MTSTAAPSSLSERPARRHGALGTLAAAIAVASPAAVAVGALGSKFGLFGPKIGFMGLTLGLAPVLALVGTVLGLITLGMAAFVKPRGRVRAPLIAVLVGGIMLALFAAFLNSASKKPPIHDVATEWDEPLMPSPQLAAARGQGVNPIQPSPVVPAGPMAKTFGGRRIAEVNAATCPAATPITQAQPVDAAFTRVRDAVKKAGLRVVSEDVAAGRLEATATSFTYGFKDDLMARVRPDGAGSRIDLRSVSRLGVSDLGQNCARITRLRDLLRG